MYSHEKVVMQNHFLTHSNGNDKFHLYMHYKIKFLNLSSSTHACNKFCDFRINFKMACASRPFRVISTYRYAKFQNFSRYASLYFELVSM